MSVAVLVVNYRAYGPLLGCLRSASAQLREGDELIVVDNSTEPSRAEAVKAAVPDAKWILSRRNLGFAKAVNLAAAQTRADYLLLLNPDAELIGPALRTLEAWLDAHHEDGIVGPRVLNADGTPQPSARRFPGWSAAVGARTGWVTRRFPDNPFARHNFLARTTDHPAHVDWVCGACVMIRRDLFDSLGGFDERFFLFFEDADFCRRAASQGMLTRFIPTSLAQHQCGISTSHAPHLANWHMHRGALLLYLRHGGPAQWVLSPLVAVGLALRFALRAALIAQRRAADAISALTRQESARAHHLEP